MNFSKALAYIRFLKLLVLRRKHYQIYSFIVITIGVEPIAAFAAYPPAG